MTGNNMICFNCHNMFIHHGILISTDGDFVCSEKCEKDFEDKKEYFFSDIVNSEEKTTEWLLGLVE